MSTSLAYAAYQAMLDSEEVKRLNKKLLEIDCEIALLRETHDQTEEELEELLRPLREAAIDECYEEDKLDE